MSHELNKSSQTIYTSIRVPAPPCPCIVNSYCIDSTIATLFISYRIDMHLCFTSKNSISLMCIDNGGAGIPLRHLKEQ